VKRKELLIILIIIIASIFIWFTNYLLKTNKNNSYLLITVDGTTYQEVPLYDKTNIDPATINTTWGYNTFIIENGAVRVTEADCPDLVCVHTKPASKVGDMIVCLPHKVVFEIRNGEENEH